MLAKAPHYKGTKKGTRHRQQDGAHRRSHAQRLHGRRPVDRDEPAYGHHLGRECRDLPGDIGFAFRLTFLNKCDELERGLLGRRVLPALLRRGTAGKLGECRAERRQSCCRDHSSVPSGMVIAAAISPSGLPCSLTHIMGLVVAGCAFLGLSCRVIALVDCSFSTRSDQGAEIRLEDRVRDPPARHNKDRETCPQTASPHRRRKPRRSRSSGLWRLACAPWRRARARGHLRGRAPVADRIG